MSLAPPRTGVITKLVMLFSGITAYCRTEYRRQPRNGFGSRGVTERRCRRAADTNGRLFSSRSHYAALQTCPYASGTGQGLDAAYDVAATTMLDRDAPLKEHIPKQPYLAAPHAHFFYSFTGGCAGSRRA